MKNIGAIFTANKQQKERAMLTKTKTLAGIQCVKRLWLHKNPPFPLAKPSLSEQHIMRQGQEIERKACEQFPNGQRVGGDNDQAPEKTLQLMADGAECLFQAAFSSNDVLVRCDILRKCGDKWDIVEVKSSTRQKDEHIDDLAVQWHIAESAGVPLGGAFLMLVNSGGCIFPDLSNLMLEPENLTDEVRKRAAKIPESLRAFEVALGAPDAPDIPIGEHCFRPRDCPFMEHCWKDMPKASIHTIPRLGWTKKDGMIERGVLCAADADVKLTETQQRYVDIVRSGEPYIKEEEIRAQLAELEFPLHFLDFETINPAIPRFDGMRPYQQFPFQFSCHILREKDGEAEPCEYLHPDETDPRPQLLSKLIDCIDQAGSIIVYHQSMEDGVLKGLADIADNDQAERLNGMRGRLWDLEAVFKKNYLHPEFLGRTSIKAVLPVLVKGMSYDGLEIKEGSNAMAAWDLTIHGEKDYAADLREYCQQDTKALVEIYHRLVLL